MAIVKVGLNASVHECGRKSKREGEKERGTAYKIYFLNIWTMKLTK